MTIRRHAAAFGLAILAVIVDARAQTAQPLPAPAGEQVRARRAAARPAAAKYRSQGVQTPAADRPAPDSELAKAILNPKLAPQPPKQPLPSLATMLLQPPARSPGVPAPYATKINLNRASLAQIQSLPGVGPGLGAHILAGRPYQTLADLARDGVPLVTLERIAPLITLAP